MVNKSEQELRRDVFKSRGHIRKAAEICQHKKVNRKAHPSEFNGSLNLM
jgi:hypothetical protein